MSCGSPILLPVEIEMGGSQSNAGSAQPAANSPSLFVSNAPEQIGSGVYAAGLGSWLFGSGPYNLCQAHLYQPNIPTKVRVFFWHISRFTTPSYWGVIVGSNTTLVGTVSNLKTHVFNPSSSISDLSPVGMCLADAQLFSTLDNANISPLSIGITEQVLWSAEVGPADENPAHFKVIAAILEFDVQTGIEFTIRSAVSLTGQSLADFGSYSTTLADNRNNFFGTAAQHNRGYWRSANIELPLSGELNCTLVQPPPDHLEWQICSEGGPESTYYSVVNSLSDKLPNDALGNPTERPNTAAYGANLTYKGTYHNYGLVDPGKVYAAIRARNVGGKYFGAGQFSKTSPSPSINSTPVKLSPVPNIGNLRGLDLTSVYPNGHIGVPPSTGGSVEFHLANAGGATTPANLILARDLIWHYPSQGGGDAG